MIVAALHCSICGREFIRQSPRQTTCGAACSRERKRRVKSAWHQNNPKPPEAIARDTAASTRRERRARGAGIVRLPATTIEAIEAIVGADAQAVSAWANDAIACRLREITKS